MNQNYQTRSRIKLAALLTVTLLLALLALTIATQAQSCSLRVVGAIANCQGSSVLWGTSTPSTSVQGYYLETYAGRFPLGQGLLPPGTNAYLIPSGCGSGGSVRVVEVRTNGTICTLDYSGNLPHARPCSQCGNSGARMATRNGANFTGNLAPGAIGAAFGDAPFTSVTQTAPLLPLPTQLGGVRFLINGTEVPLFYASPTQVNFLVPESFSAMVSETIARAAFGQLHENESIAMTPDGIAALYIAQAYTQDGNLITGDVLVSPNAPGIFTAGANGDGRASAIWFVFGFGGVQVYNPGNLVIRQGDRTFLVLFGTGVTERVNWTNNGQTITTGAANLRIVQGNQARVYQAGFVGPAPPFVGLYQFNFEIPTADLWRGDVGAQITLSNFANQSWQTNGFTVAALR